MGRLVRKLLGVGLALSLVSLASCVPPPNPYKSTRGGAGTLGSSSSSYGTYGSSGSYSGGGGAGSSSSGTQYHFSQNDPVSNAESRALTDYLHTHRLPLVGARVLAYNGSGPRKAILYGFVATPFGKSDAVAKSRRFLNDPGAEIDNRIMIKPELAGSSAPAGTSSGSTSSDIKSYEAQQRLAEQQQQYMAQQYQYQSQSPSLMLLLPLLGLFGSGAFGGGSSSFSVGGGAYGYPAYPPSYAPSYPPGYSSPYSTFP